MGDDAGDAGDGEFDIGFELLGGSGVEVESTLDVSCGEGLSHVEDNLLFCFLAFEEGHQLSIFEVDKIEGDKSVDTTFFGSAVLVELNNFAIDIVASTDGLGGLKLAVAVDNVVQLGVDILGRDFNLVVFDINLVPSDFEFGSHGDIEEESEGGLLTEVEFASLLIVGHGHTENVELFVVDILEERGVESVLHGIANDGGLVHALDERLRSHTLAETGDGGLVLILFQLLGNVFNVVFFLDINLDTEFQIT